MGMNLAEKIERVLYFCKEKNKNIPKKYLRDCRNIKDRYSEIKLTKDFERAGELARYEWVEEELDKLKNKVHSYYRD